MKTLISPCIEPCQNPLCGHDRLVHKYGLAECAFKDCNCTMFVLAKD